MMDIILIITISFIIGYLSGAWNERRVKVTGLMKRASDDIAIDHRLHDIDSGA